MSFFAKIEGFIDRIESPRIPFVNFIFTFIFTVVLVSVGNLLVSGRDFSSNVSAYVWLCQILFILSLILILHFSTGERIYRISRFVLALSVFLVISFLINLVSRGEGLYDIIHALPETYSDLSGGFLTPFGIFNARGGIGLGTKTGVVLTLFATFLYTYIKKKGFIKGIVYCFLAYVFIFFCFSMPFMVRLFLDLSGIEYIYLNVIEHTARTYLLTATVLLLILFFLQDRDYFLKFFGKIEPFQLLHFEAMLFMGNALAFVFSSDIKKQGALNLFSDLLFVAIATLFVHLLYVLIGEQDDSGNGQPGNDVKRALVPASLLMVLLYAWAVNPGALFLVILFMGNYFLYFMPPFRLERSPIFSKIILSFNSFVILVAGYFLGTNRLDLPNSVKVFFFIPFIAALNFIDIKNYKDDKKTGIKTLPVLVGLRNSKLIVGFFFLLAYFFVYFILNNVLLLPFFLLFSLLQFLAINNKRYREEIVFFLYFVSISFLLLYFGISNKMPVVPW
ncbi:MAG: hypothetical protein GF370_04400 [Candidatus Nealsonbacteria bacterium]|nr:hypothetical protein [Candidatus Nealsonbacteria bacterium]